MVNTYQLDLIHYVIFLVRERRKGESVEVRVQEEETQVQEEIMGIIKEVEVEFILDLKEDKPLYIDDCLNGVNRKSRNSMM